MKKTKKIKQLWLSSTSISKVDCLCEILSNNLELEVLDLSQNEIRSEGLKKICDGLKETKSIKQLWMN